MSDTIFRYVCITFISQSRILYEKNALLSYIILNHGIYFCNFIYFTVCFNQMNDFTVLINEKKSIKSILGKKIKISKWFILKVFLSKAIVCEKTT